MSTVDVRDLAEATAKIILNPQQHKGAIYDLTGPESLNFYDVAHELSDLLGRQISYVPVPDQVAKQSMLDAGMPEWNALALAELQALFATGRYSEVSEELADLLGRKPRSFREFAMDHLDAFR